MQAILLYTKPHPEYVDPVVVARALAGDYGSIKRPLSLAEAAAVLGPLMDQVDELRLSGQEPDGRMTRFDEFMCWSNTKRMAVAKLARPGRIPAPRAPGWEAISKRRRRVA